MLRRVITAAVLAAGATTAVACGDPVEEPTLPTVDFAPSATLTVTPDAIGCALFRVTTGPDCSVPAGSVVEVANEGADNRRVVADGIFDTGILRPGDTTTVVVTDVGTFEVYDDAEPEHTLELVVTPRDEG
jgi:hypothetical protein